MTDNFRNRQGSCCVVLPTESVPSRRMLLNSRVFAHDSSAPVSHISNKSLISRNISCLTWSPICLPAPPPPPPLFISSVPVYLTSPWLTVTYLFKRGTGSCLSSPIQRSIIHSLPCLVPFLTSLLFVVSVCFFLISFPSLLVSFLCHFIFLFVSTVSLFCFCNICIYLPQPI
jgi:hypothetical protein